MGRVALESIIMMLIKAILEAIWWSGETQVEERRAHVLDRAERLFLQTGLENATMTDIAGQAGITRMTLYCYFPNHDSIAVEVAHRLLKRMDAVNNVNLDDGMNEEDRSILLVRRYAQAMIENFYELRDIYRLISVFPRRDCASDGKTLRQFSSVAKSSIAFLSILLTKGVIKYPSLPGG